MILMLLEVPSFPAVFFFPFRFSFFPSFICHNFVFCFIFLTRVFISFCFLLVVSFCPGLVPCLYSFFFTIFVMPFHSFFIPIFCFLWLLYEPWAAKWRGFLRKSPSSLRYQVVSCSLGWRDKALCAVWFPYYIFFVLILSFRRVLYVVCFLLGISPASEV